jgi:hypothetical protein
MNTTPFLFLVTFSDVIFRIFVYFIILLLGFISTDLISGAKVKDTHVSNAAAVGVILALVDYFGSFSYGLIMAGLIATAWVAYAITFGYFLRR